MVNLGGEDIVASFPEAEGGGDGGRGADEPAKPRALYTMPGVLHFVQHEWSRFEMERAQWEMERAELQARISFLQGERKGQENLKLDLVRRIKMLEYSLKQERIKLYRLSHGGADPDPDAVPDCSADMEPHVPMDVDATDNEQKSWRDGRKLLRSYLQEIGYSETILDVRSFRVRNLLGVSSSGADSRASMVDNESAGIVDRHLRDAQDAIMHTAAFLPKPPSQAPPDAAADDRRAPPPGAATSGVCSDSDEDITVLEPKRSKARRLLNEEEGLAAEGTRVLDDEFMFLASEEATGGRRHDDADQWQIDAHALDRMKSEYRQAARNKKPRAVAAPDAADDDAPQHAESAASMGLTLDAALGLTDDADIADEMGPDEEEAAPKKWNLRWTLRSHWDAVRAMQFHPVDSLLVTAADDGTVKLWNLAPSKPAAAQTHSPTAISDLEPVYTCRGHRGAVLSLTMSPTGDMCYTGGLDGTLRCWSLPSPNVEMHDKYEPKVLTETLSGHADAVWSVAFHSSDNRLVSASADGTLKLWEPGGADVLLRTFGAVANAVPTSVDFVSTEPQQLLAAYAPGAAAIVDLETGASVLNFDFAPAHGETVGRVAQIASHPTMPVTVTAGDDKRIRYFDNNTGRLIQATVGHERAISSLALDPSGLYLLSGAHDGSLRLWNMEKRVCLQEISAHRCKWDESVLAVAFHPSRKLIGSAGADAFAKVFS